MRDLETEFRGVDKNLTQNGTTREAAAGTQPSLASVEAGSPVFCANGTDIGRVSAVLPDAFILERGSFMERQTYRIPATAVARIAGTHVILNVGCQELEQFRRS